MFERSSPGEETGWRVIRRQMPDDLRTRFDQVIATRDPAAAYGAIWRMALWRFAHAELQLFMLHSGRIYDEMSPAIGLYDQWLPCRSRCSSRSSFEDLLADTAQIQRDAADSLEYYPLHAAEPNATPHGSGFAFIRLPESWTQERVTFTLESVSARHDVLPLTLVVLAGASTTTLEFHYAAGSIETAHVESLADAFVRILAGAVERPAAPLVSHSMSADPQAVTPPARPCTSSVLNAFVDRMRQTPDRIALVWGDESMSYRQLHTRARALALHIGTVPPGSCVALLLPRGPEAIVGILAAWTCGAAYVALDPRQPMIRTNQILDELDPAVILTERSYSAGIESRHRVLAIDRSDGMSTAGRHSRPFIDAHAAAYVMFTSGSTGTPKGVTIEHGSLVNLWSALDRDVYRGCAGEMRIGLNAPLHFDASVKQVIQLCSGATLALFDDDTRRDGAELLQGLQRHACDAIDLTPAQVRGMLQTSGSTAVLSRLSRVLVGGEALDEATWDALAAIRGPEIYNVYGPTECTVDATICRIAPGPVSLGGAIAGAHVTIRDPWLDLMADGLRGELCIGGAGVARGYWNAPAFTATRFVPDPAGVPSSRLYRTGDAACRERAGGALQFLGRFDRQAKVRGFRVELEEIERAILQHRGIQQAAVVVADDRLVAYTVADATGPRDTQLADWLRARVPEHMVPSVFVPLRSLPLKSNGKVDYAALPAAIPATESSVSPSAMTPTEEALAGLWTRFLKTETLSRDDDFFQRGGHSILAVQLVARIRDVLKVELRIRDLFERPKLRDLAAYADQLRNAGRPVAPPIESVPRDRPLPASFAQERLYFLQQLFPESSAYNVPLHVRLDGPLNTHAFADAIGLVVARHEVLRTILSATADGVQQIIQPFRSSGLSHVDLSGLDSADREGIVQRLATAQTARPFHLGAEVPCRLNVVRLARDSHALTWTLHHAIIDQWSLPLLFRNLASEYRDAKAGRSSSLAPLTRQYADFAVWQRQQMTPEFADSELTYWTTRLSQLTPLEVPCDRPRPPVQSFHGGRVQAMVPSVLLERLRALCQGEAATIFMGLLAVWKVLLFRYTGQADIAIGTPVATRGHAEIEDLIGFFLNTVVMRTDLSGAPTFRTLLARVRDTALGAYSHADVPFERVVEAMHAGGDLSRYPLFQVLFAQGQRSVPESLGELSLTRLKAQHRAAMFDLLLFASEEPDGLRNTVDYASDLFDATRVQRMLGHFGSLLEAVTSAPDEPITELPLFNDIERHQLLLEWNDTGRPARLEASVIEVFNSRAAAHPERIALVQGETQLTYGRLNATANRCACYLRRLGVGAETFVGLCMNRSPEMIAMLLGILKAGGAYVGLNTHYPKARLDRIVSHTGATVVTDRAHAHLVAGSSSTVVIVEDVWPAIEAECGTPVMHRPDPLQPVYVTYTSGSTGQPKGIVMIQQALMNLLLHHALEPQIEGCQRTLQFSPLSFDVSFQDVFSTWLAGGTLVLIDDEQHQDLAGLPAIIRTFDVHRAFLPVAALQQVAAEAARSAMCLPLRKVSTGSERVLITPDMVATFERSAGCVLCNEYGPSEAHVVSTKRLDGAPSAWPERPAIGRPIPNTSIYLVDRDLRLTPMANPGELCIGGVSLARGYLNAPDLTAERFLPDPFADTPGSRLYRTGDLARHDEAGVIHYLGRIDHQTKIRGYRIEPGEIETSLLAQPGVGKAVVITREDRPGDRRLVAYVTENGDVPLHTTTLRAALRDHMPDYMVPAAVVVLDALPLNANGKVDRRALPAPVYDDLSREGLGQSASPLERILASIWCEVLSIQRVGVDDDFFDLGGHSLLATRVLARINQLFSVKVPFRTFFECSTIATLAAAMTASDPDGRVEAMTATL